MAKLLRKRPEMALESIVGVGVVGLTFLGSCIDSRLVNPTLYAGFLEAVRSRQ